MKYYYVKSDPVIFEYYNIGKDRKNKLNFEIWDEFDTNFGWRNWDQNISIEDPKFEPFFANPKFPLLDIVECDFSIYKGFVISKKACEIIRKYFNDSFVEINFPIKYKEEIISDYKLIYFTNDYSSLIDFNNTIFNFHKGQNFFKNMKLQNFEELRELLYNKIWSIDNVINLTLTKSEFDFFMLFRINRTCPIISEKLKLELEANTLGFQFREIEITINNLK